ncbi:SMP-30/gluconolactonase/LRE family protein [Streptomyces boncukensis]|uniref:Superoxide dismutase n=1 Tax=Streptomyces boncukensis TaxID=2711219 RepID=A0A6G4X0E5_9ACTN|nr:superoxide dismutase [Streptomyces boncukensis]NGO70360.1 superoxide dismutase [Streptomyces boncukensis]
MTRNDSRPSRRTVLGGAGLAALATAAAGGTALAGPRRGAGRPTEFPLPDGFQPEGITIGKEPYAYLGSLANGAVYRADLRTGRGRVVYAGAEGTSAVGVKLDHDGLLYIAGRTDGTVRVLDTHTGTLVATHQAAPESGHFINDAVLLRDRAWFTDSYDSVLYGVPRGRYGPHEIRELPLGGDWQQEPDGVNANGVVATPDERALIVVNSPLGRLYRVSLRTGRATEIALRGAEDVVGGDGLVRLGSTLYVVQNRQNVVSVFTLDERGTTAKLRRRITDPRFDVPTTAAPYRNRLYLVNARFTTPPEPDTEYNVVAVPL